MDATPLTKDQLMELSPLDIEYRLRQKKSSFAEIGRQIEISRSAVSNIVNHHVSVWDAIYLTLTTDNK